MNHQELQARIGRLQTMLEEATDCAQAAFDEAHEAEKHRKKLSAELDALFERLSTVTAAPAPPCPFAELGRAVATGTHSRRTVDDNHTDITVYGLPFDLLDAAYRALRK